MQRFALKGGRGLGRTIGVTLALTGLAVAFAAAASGSPAQKSSATPAQVQAIVNKALAANVPVASLDPTMKAALALAAEPLTQAQLDLAYKCWKAGKCTLGSGKLTVGVADGFGDNTWRKFSWMEIVLQAIKHPEVGKISYANAHGNLATMQANLRSLAAQGAQAIVAYNDFGPAASSAFTAAQKKGAVVTTYVSPTRPIPGIPASAVGVAVGPDICAAGVTMANATVKAVGKTAEVAFYTGTPGNPEDVGWQKCALDTFNKSYPGIKVTYRADTNWTPAGVFAASSALISSGKPVKAILYSYSNPVPQIIKAFTDAGKQVPAVITWTQDNGTSCQWKKLKAEGKGFTLYQTNGLNWAARVAFEAALEKVAGQKVNPTILYPQPFISAKLSDCVASLPADYPGSSSLIPQSLIKKMLGS
jgi:ABC-type sugar transport system substrate-binding protein